MSPEANLVELYHSSFLGVTVGVELCVADEGARRVTTAHALAEVHPVINVDAPPRLKDILRPLLV